MARTGSLMMVSFIGFVGVDCSVPQWGFVNCVSSLRHFWERNVSDAVGNPRAQSLGDARARNLLEGENLRSVHSCPRTTMAPKRKSDANDGLPAKKKNVGGPPAWDWQATNPT